MRERYRMPSRMPQCVNSLPKMDKASRSLRSQTGRARSWCLRSGDKSRWSPKDFGNGLWDSKWTGISPAQLVPKLISKSQHLHHHVDFYFWPWTSNSLKDGKNGTPKYPNSLLLRKLEDLLWVLPLLNHQVGPQCVRVGDTWSQQWWGFFANIANLGMALTLHGWYVVHPCASCRFKLWYTSIHSRDLNGIWPYEWLWKHLLGLTTIQHLFQLSGFWGLGGIVQMYWLHVFCTWLLLHLQCLRSCCCHCC